MRGSLRDMIKLILSPLTGILSLEEALSQRGRGAGTEAQALQED